ncbi:FG-GAP repeat domain-containing protein [Streptomyces sp. NPDC048825]|uniref:FG-GAP repeat domain-containing protein n=1 Tax=Streptomyces sp. NPDC048825 TaxID=3365592 RepID=UPI00372142FA
MRATRGAVLVACAVLLGAAATGCDTAGGGSGDGGSRATGPGAPSAPTPPNATSTGFTLGALAQGPDRPAAGQPQDRPREGDLNGDGYDDVALARPGAVYVVYGSAGGPDPRTRTTLAVGGGHPGRDADNMPRLHRADLDGDGFTDLLVTVNDGKQYALWGGARGITGIRQLAVSGEALRELGPAGGDSGSVADFDGDGSGDVFRLGRSDGSSAGSAGVVFHGPFDRRTGKPARQAELTGPVPADSAPYQSTSEDYDGDGRAELTVWFEWTDPDSEGDGDLSVRGVHHFRGTARGLVRAQESEQGEEFAGHPGDVDGDGDDELYKATFSAYDQKIAVSVNSAPGKASSASPVTLTDLPGLNSRCCGGTEGRAVGDVTGDGRPDLVLSAPAINSAHGLVFLIPDIARVTPATKPQAVDLESTGVDGDNRDPGAGDKQYIRHRLISKPPLLDVNGDGRLDVVAASGNQRSEDGSGTRRTRGFWVFPGSPEGLDTKASRHVTEEELDLG